MSRYPGIVTQRWHTGLSTLTRPGRPAVPDDYDSPLTELAAMAVQNHELYTAYVTAGFTEPQAMQLLIAIVTAGIGGGQ